MSNDPANNNPSTSTWPTPRSPISTKPAKPYPLPQETFLGLTDLPTGSKPSPLGISPDLIYQGMVDVRDHHATCSEYIIKPTASWGHGI